MQLEKRIITEIRKRPAWKRTLGRYWASEIHDIYRGKKNPLDFFLPSHFDDRMLMIFEIGKMYHAHVQTFFKPEEVEVKVEHKVDDFVISGSIDLLPADSNIPCELKSCTKIPVSINRSHETQIRVYTHLIDAPYGYVTYIAKDPKAFITRSFKVVRNDDQFKHEVDAVRVYHNKIKELHKNGKLAI